MNQAEYNAKLARAEELMALDPELNTAAGRELDALADELQEYERSFFPFQVTKQDIAYLRGGLPGKCSFCDRDVAPEQLEPEEAGDWACWWCLLKWAKEDDHLQEAAFWERSIKEFECRRTPSNT
jgi:hypothetical protein